MSDENAGLIMVLDDDMTSRVVVEAFLRKGNYVVLGFQDPVSAILRLDEGPVDLVVSDWFMPDMNGAEFMERAKKRHPELPFIFLTSNNDMGNAITMIRSGADDYVVKPVNAEDILFRVGKILELQRSRAAISQMNREKEILAMENQQLVHWRLMYANKDSHQADQIINLLERTINQSGGFMWLDLFTAMKQEREDGVLIPTDVATLIVDSATRQRQLFELLSYVKTIRSKELNLERLELADFGPTYLRPLVEKLAPQIRDFGKTLTLNHGNLRAGSVFLDRELVAMSIQELLINAMKYSPEASDIIVEALCEDRQGVPNLVLYVRHPACRKPGPDGKDVIGIPYELSEQIFELFYTLDPFPQEVSGEIWTNGTGLFFVRQIFKRLGGWVACKNGLDYTAGSPRPFVQMVATLPLAQ